MTSLTDRRGQDEIVLVARILLALVFIVFGWSKLTGYEGAVGYMTQTGVPVPPPVSEELPLG